MAVNLCCDYALGALLVAARKAPAFRDGLLKEVAYRDAGGAFVRKAGVMGVVLRGGPVRPGDAITVELPPLPHEALDRV